MTQKAMDLLERFLEMILEMLSNFWAILELMIFDCFGKGDFAGFQFSCLLQSYG